MEAFYIPIICRLASCELVCDTVSWTSSYTNVRVVLGPNYDTLNMLFCVLREMLLDCKQVTVVFANQPVFQKGKEINYNFSGRAIEIV